jgi:hypothetical protein
MNTMPAFLPPCIVGRPPVFGWLHLAAGRLLSPIVGRN